MNFKFALVIVVGLISSCKICYSAADCLSNSAKSSVSDLLRAFSSSQQSDNVLSDNEECMDSESQIGQIEAKFDQLGARINVLHANEQLKRSISEARRIFDAVYIVYSNLKDYWKVNEQATRQNAKRECKHNHPKNALMRLQRETTGEVSLFLEIVSGSRYSERVFNETTSVLITESAVAAILAIECDRLINPNASLAVQTLWKSNVKEILETINQKIEQAKSHLLDGYQNAVQEDVVLALAEINEKRMERRASGKYIHELLNEKYPFRAWATMIYRHVPIRAYAAHAHEGTNDNWFLKDNGQHTVVVHGADRSTNCSRFADSVRGKKLRDIIGNQDVYRDISTGEVAHLGAIIELLRRTLREKHGLPNDHFISVVAYRSDLSVNREYDYHFFEHLLDPSTENPTRTVLIGWC